MLILALFGLCIPSCAQKKKGKTVESAVSSVVQKKPTLMILPSDNWCTLRMFTTTFDNQGPESVEGGK